MNIPMPRPTAIASTLLWFVAALLLLLALSLGIFSTSSKSPPGAGHVPLAMMLWALPYLVGGYALRRQKWGFRWWTVGLCVSAVAGAFLFLTPMTLIVLVLNVAALALVARDWRRAGK